MNSTVATGSAALQEKENGWYKRWRVDEPERPEPSALVSRPASISFWKIVIAVIVGNLITGIVGAVVYAMLATH